MNVKTLSVVAVATLLTSDFAMAAGKGDTDPETFHGACITSLANNTIPFCDAFLLAPGERAEIQTVSAVCNQIMSDVNDADPVSNVTVQYPSPYGQSIFAIPLTESETSSGSGAVRYQVGNEHGPFYLENDTAGDKPIRFAAANWHNTLPESNFNFCRFEVHGVLN